MFVGEKTTITTLEPTVTHPNHSQPTVYIGFTPPCAFYYFQQMNNYIYPSQIYCIYLIALLPEIPIICFFITLASENASNNWHFYYLYSFAYSRELYAGIKQYVCLFVCFKLDWHLSHSSIHLRFFHVFLWLDSFSALLIIHCPNVAPSSLNFF